MNVSSRSLKIIEVQGNWRLGTTTVAYLTKKGILLVPDPRDDFRGRGGGNTPLLLPPGVENLTYATVLPSGVLKNLRFEN